MENIQIKPGPGADPKYDESWHPMAAADLILISGAALNKVAKSLRVSHTTVYRWMNKHEEFREAVLDAQATWNTGVLTLSLVKRAKGFRFTETTRELAPLAIIEKDGKPVAPKLIVTKKVTKYVAPDTGALKFALTNFAPDRYRERKEIELDTKVPLEMTINTKPKADDGASSPKD